ncbi:MAG: MCE family protein [Gemmatimonadaceae bacterium]|nr:MCE family protein [Gemmatimonadaceae bacterium]
MKRRDEVLVGIFTTAAIAVIIVGALWLARGGLSSGYPLYSRFPWGSGLKQGQPVWLAGVTAGFVDDVDLDPNGTVVVTYRLRKEYKVPKGTKATVVANGFFGDMAIALTPDGATTEAFAPGDTIPLGIAPTGLAALTARADTITNGVNVLLGNARMEMVDSGGIREMRQALAATNRLVVQLAQIAALQSRELQSTLVTVRSRAAAIDSLQVDSTVRSLRAASANMATLTGELKSTTDRLNTVLGKVEKGDGTAAMLLNDPGLYQDLRRVLTRMDSLTADFKKNPKRYINLEIF